MAGERLTIILPESFDNVHDVANGDILHGLLSLKIQSPRIKAFEDFLCDLDVHKYGHFFANCCIHLSIYLFM